MSHWLQRWNARTGVYSRREAEYNLLWLMELVRPALRPTDALRRYIWWSVLQFLPTGSFFF